MTRIYLACSITKRFFNERALTTVGTLLTTFLFSALLHAKPGDLDTSGFAAPTGRTSFSLNSSLNHVGRGIVVQPDGKIVVAGACPVGTLRGFCVARYESDGNIDTSYGDSSGLTATAMSTLNAFATAAAAQQDGKIVVVGACEVGSASNLDFCLARYTTAGILDSTFNSNGKVITNTGTGIDEVNAVVIQTDGKIVVAGGCRGTKLNFCVLRYNSNGSPDSTFGTSGRVTTSMSTGDDFITAIALQSDGKLVVFGACNFVSCLARYVSTNGALDTTFDGDGKLIDPLGVQTGGTGFNASGGGLVIQLDGKIVTGGRWAQSGTFGGTEGSFALRRYEASGATDTTFGNAGTTRFDVTTGNNNTFVDQMWALTIQPIDGKFVIVGGCRDNSNNDTYTCVARAHNDGSIDLGFGDKGKAFGALRSQNFAVAIQTDSKIITTGECDVFFGSSQTFCTERRLGGPQPYRQCSLDIDGDGAVQATTDTLIATRVALGMIGASVLTGINLSGKPRSNWNDIREFLVTQCGMTIAP